MSKAEFQVRFQKQTGKNTLFPFGFHCSGSPIPAAAKRLEREIASGKIVGSEDTKTQYEIMQQLGIPEDKIGEFRDPNHWISYYPPLNKTDLIDFGVAVDWDRSFITTSANPYYDKFVRW